MLIDWFTVGAQAINFIILVWLMKRFLYGPILSAIDAREKRIASELADADAKRAEAQRERDDFQRKNEAFDQQRADLMARTTDEVNAERKRLLDKVRAEADALAARRQESLRTEARTIDQAIRRRTEREAFAIARKALSDLATTSLEERVTDVFTRRLREIDADSKATLAEAIRSTSDPVLIRSAFELPPEQRTVIQNAVNTTFAAEVPLRFEVVPELVSGIEFTASGQKVSWSIAGYLASLEETVGELLNRPAAPVQTADHQGS